MSLRGLNLMPAWRYRKAALPIVLASPLLPPLRMPERPVFIIGCPRSGTTMLFRLLRRVPGVVTMRTEGHVLWETFHHPREHGWRSSELSAGDVTSMERRYVATTIRLIAGRGRFVDKTPRNVLRLSYLEAMFPDATFVYLYRDGRDIVASLFESWIRKGGDSPYHVPGGFAVEGFPEGVWWFVLPAGWEAMNGRCLEDVCAFQYVSCVRAMLDFREVERGGTTVQEVRYEDLCREPVPTYRQLLDRLELQLPETDVRAAASEIRPLQVEPKWRSRERQIESVMPVIRPFLELTGYDA